MQKDWEIEEPVEFFVENDYYLINGKRYWRVTRVKSVINQAGLNRWFMNTDASTIRKVLKSRQNFGTKAHKLFELKVSGKKVNSSNYKDEELLKDLELMDELIPNCELKAESVEQHLWSNKYGVAGTADYLGNYKSNSKYLKKGHEPKFSDGAFVIGDWKTSSGIFEDYWLQLAIYVIMFEDLTDKKVDGAFIALFRNGKLTIEEKTREELDKYFKVFLHCIPLFEYTKGEFNDTGL